MRNVGGYSSVAYLDLTKAFNCVNHQILIDKFQHYGFKGNCLKWLISYLHNRSQFTKVNNFTSNTTAVPSGVPQGSILGPIFYLIYVNDIGALKNITSFIYMFADDTVIVSSGVTPKESSDRLTSDLTSISRYFNNLNLLLNPEKTKVMYFDKLKSGKNIHKFGKVVVKNTEIEVVESFKYLGFLIDRNLNFSCHVKYCVKQANHKLYLLRRIRNYMSSKTSLMIYKAMVLPYLEYGSSFMLSCTQAEKRKFQCLQNRGLKVALNKCNFFNTRILHKESRLADWETRARLSSCRLMFKYKFDEEFIECNRSNTRAHDGPIFKQEQPSSVNFVKSPTYIFRKEWNSLPSMIRVTNDYDRFKILLKRHYWNSYFDVLQQLN